VGRKFTISTLAINQGMETIYRNHNCIGTASTILFTTGQIGGGGGVGGLGVLHNIPQVA